MSFRMFVVVALLTLVACGGTAAPADGAVAPDATTQDAAASDAAMAADGAVTDAAVADAAVEDAASDAQTDASTLPLGLYRGTCDGSAAVWFDATHFLSFDDETQTWRIFTAGTDGAAVQSAAFGAALGVGGEADVEDAARVGDRVYAITSHGRDKNGNLEDARYRFFAFDVAGTVPAATLTFAGSTSTLLEAMLDEDDYVNDDADVRALLTVRSNLSDPVDANLAPKVNGTAIEGLAVLPDGTTLAIGFRNPQIAGDAIVVTLANPSAVLTGATPSFERVIRMDLGGLGVRGMTYDAARAVVWILAGPHNAAAGPFRLYSWSGDHTEAPVSVMTLTPPVNSAPEAVLPIPDGDSLRILYDQGSVIYVGTECKELTSAAQRYGDVVVLAP